MKKTKSFTGILSVIVCFALVAAVALTFASCKGTDTNSSSPEKANSGESVTHTFKFIVTDKDGKQTSFDIETDKKTVGEALIDKGLIEGEDGQYGLYVKKVNGISADYEKDGVYWAFYENGNMAVNGVEKTDIKDGATYEFRVSK